MSETRTETPKDDANDPLLPPRIREVLDRIKSIWRRLPFAAALFIVTAGATVAAVGAYFAFAPMMTEYAVLYGKLEGEDAGTIVEKLKAQQIPYELTGDGSTIKVPKGKVHELRLSLAAEGLPKGGHVGFESFENMRLGATEFEQQVVYRRAMEGELARTIATVHSVQSARVHLVMPKPSVFAQKKEAATASVIVRLKGARMQDEEVSSIVNLVASAVPGLEADRITLVTTDGRMLHRPRAATADGEAASGAEQDQLAQKRGVEALLEERARTMLERVLGPGHVDVRVTADLDSAKVETTSDKYDHSKSSMRSEQQLLEEAGANAQAPNAVAGVPGAEANLPGAEAVVGAAPDLGNGATVRRQHTRNFEIDRVQERRISVSQSVKRLTVAVVLDGVPSPTNDGTVVERPTAEVDKLAQLVRSAVGYNEERGDLVTVESVRFYIEKLPEPEAEPRLLPIPEKYRATYDKFLPLAKLVGASIGSLIVLLMVRKYLKNMRLRADKQRAQELQSQERIAKLQLEASRANEAALRAAEIDHRAEALRRATEDPATAALVLRRWLAAAPAEQAKPAAAA
jgi:flagellar M-ring protein FliF